MVAAGGQAAATHSVARRGDVQFPIAASLVATQRGCLGAAQGDLHRHVPARDVRVAHPSERQHQALGTVSRWITGRERASTDKVLPARDNVPARAGRLAVPERVEQTCGAFHARQRVAAGRRNVAADAQVVAPASFARGVSACEDHSAQRRQVVVVGADGVVAVGQNTSRE